MLFASNIEHCRPCVPGWGASVWTPPLTPCAPAKCQVSQALSCLSMSFVSLNASLYLSRCLYFLYRCPQFLYLSLYLSISLYTSLHLSMSLYISLCTPLYTIYLSIPLYISLCLSISPYIPPYTLYISLYLSTSLYTSLHLFTSLSLQGRRVPLLRTVQGPGRVSTRSACRTT